jgi:hypothetical protein
VGGVSFTTTLETLRSVPDTFFQAALSDTWRASGASMLEINRDGTHFQYIVDFLRYGCLPRDRAGCCNIPEDVLEALRVEADFYGLTALVSEIDELLQFKIKGMRYFISSFFLNSGPSGGLTLSEYATYEEAKAVYEKYKLQHITEIPSYVDEVIVNDVLIGKGGEGYGQNIVVNEMNNPETGFINHEVYEDGSWKRPMGLQLLCIPISIKASDQLKGALYECGQVRTHPKNRTYY